MFIALLEAIRRNADINAQEYRIVWRYNRVAFGRAVDKINIRRINEPEYQDTDEYKRAIESLYTVVTMFLNKLMHCEDAWEPRGFWDYV